MYKVMSYEEIERTSSKKDYVLIDLRSEGEYKEATIPGAINIAILNNKERELVGRAYKKDSVEKAKLLGLEFVGNKLAEMYKEISSLDQEGKSLVFFCSRGGFRSSSLVALLNSIGTEVIKLEDGYKGYRRYILERFPSMMEKIKFVVLYGNTGTGKTEILKKIRREGRDVLDLEAAANHRGSILGGVGLGEQTSQKMFESILYHTIRDRSDDIIFTEGESRRIGRVAIPEYIYDKIRSGIHIDIHSPLDYRIETILGDYVDGTDDELIEAISGMEKRLGKKKIQEYIEAIKGSNYKMVIKELMINYYDPLYEKNTRNFVKRFDNKDHAETAGKIITWTDNYIEK